eukprot:m.25733 g.25733  ORF g.25733 m.25733 type:complete len:61 (-) comp11415_c0_seq2:42-224(-)
MSYKISPAEHESVEQLRAAAGAHKIHPDLLATKRLFQARTRQEMQLSGGGREVLFHVPGE